MNISQKDLYAMIGDQQVQIRMLEQKVAQLEQRLRETEVTMEDETAEATNVEGA